MPCPEGITPTLPNAMQSSSITSPIPNSQYSPLPILPKEPTRLLNLLLPVRKVPAHDRRILAAANNPPAIELQFEHPAVRVRRRGVCDMREVRVRVLMGGRRGGVLGGGGCSGGRAVGRTGGVHDLLD